MTPTTTPFLVPATLKRSWGVVVVLYVLLASLLYLWLQRRWSPAPWWLLLTAVISISNLLNLWLRLRQNHRADEAVVLPRFGPGNWLTILRGLAIAMMAGMLVAPRPDGSLAWLAVLLYTAADIADYFDGYLARRANHATKLGEYLDVSYDGLGMFLVTLLAVRYGQLPWWYLLLGLARYLFLGGIWLRQKLGWPLYPMPDSVHRRVFAGFQMGFMSVVLWPILPPAQATIAGTMFALPTALGFLRDWLMTIGWIRPDDPRYRRWQGILFRHSTTWLALLLRLSGSLVLLFVLAQAEPFWQPRAWQQLLAGWGVPGPGFCATVTAFVAVVAAISLLTGSMARVWSILACFPLGFDSLANGFQSYHALAIIAVTSVMLLGPGWYALWRPEQPFIRRRAGESA